MKIEMHEVKVRDLFAGFVDAGEEGVRGYSGKLNIRPKYQREFVYDSKKRNAVIETVSKGFPLNTMYWAVAGDEFELMDGQQRTISICQFVNNDFSLEIDGTTKYFHSLPENRREQILDYELSVYVCEGAESEKLDWFKIINIAGSPLTDQELRNAIYTGPWLSDAKTWFSKTGAPAAAIGDKLVNGTPIRQELLERTLEWISGGKDNIENYMSAHQFDPNAKPLWDYFENVIEWANATFPYYRKEMKGLPWGPLYNAHKDKKFDPEALEKRVSELMQDREITKPAGIYEYLLTGSERTLNLRAFDDRDKRSAYEKQKGICPVCTKHYKYEEMDGDHIEPWSKGGKTVPENCQMLCKRDNRLKSGY